MGAKFEIKRSKDGEFFFHLKGANGEIILVSEMYRAKASAKNGIASIKKNALDDKRYQRKEAANGRHMFNLRAANHEVVATSQGYSSAEARDGGIAAVKELVANAATEDLTIAAAAHTT